ncbi:hypothetical protein ACFP1H_01645 [Secundilactobacillus hailunensis]|uniref:Surface layer protein A domain-containing protein n=1 Tax=Secundilactobacillus hailunensis TaxID=2559923 RepID=A0ABW1T7R8_9LACO|nr:hypothetical protein [Secundilactobacillus hailunensis]
MTQNIWRKTATVILGATLVGGVFVEIPNAVTTTQAQAATKISYSTYTSDLSGLKAALGKASPVVQGEMASSLKIDPNMAYTDSGIGSFGTYLSNLGASMFNSVTNNDEDAKAFQADLNALVASYNVFKSRLSNGSQSQLESLKTGIQSQIKSYNLDVYVWGQVDTLATSLSGYADALDNAMVDDYGSNYHGVTAEPKAKASTKKSYISKLSIKKYSNKNVKVTGTAKLYKSANYARINTYKGNKYTKLSSKHNFSKTVYAPKAKTVKVTVGHYSHGHFTSVTSTKTVHIK